MAYKQPEHLDSWQSFTKKIYGSWDADPGYYAIQHTSMDPDQRLRLAVAWCSYYNLGIAADASELSGKRFWDYLINIYPTAKRATERRHFRGSAGMIALEQWRARWPQPENMARFMSEDAETYFDIRKRGQQVAQYGDYFYWKWCDLTEVLGFGSLDMTRSEKYSPKLPQQGALLINSMQPGGMFREADTDHQVVKIVYAEIAKWGRANKIPPRTTTARPFGIQEAETVCCVYKQMASGSYRYGTRTAKAVRRLRAANSDTAGRMAATLLSLSPWSEAKLNRTLDSLTE